MQLMQLGAERGRDEFVHVYVDLLLSAYVLALASFCLLPPRIPVMSRLLGVILAFKQA